MVAFHETPNGSTQLLRQPKGPPATMQPTKVPERLTWQLLFVVFSASFGAWFPIGYSYGVTNPIQTIVLTWIREVKCSRYELDSNLTADGDAAVRPNGTLPHPADLWCKVIPEEEESRMLDYNSELNTIWAVVGCALATGAFMSLWSTNFWLDRFGTKKTMLYNNCVGVIGALLTGLCVVGNSFEMLIIGRLVLGFNIGIAVSVVPLFCTEISPPNLRGAMGTVPGVMLVVGSLCAIVLGLPQIFGTPELWTLISWMRLVPCVVLFLTLPFCPESPRYLLLRVKDKIAARKALEFLRGTDDVQTELTNIQTEGEIMADESQTISVVGIFKDPFLRKVIMINLVCIASQQLSGVGPITIYTSAIFSKAGLSRLAALYGTIGVFILQIVSVFLSMVLLDRAGRRMLLLIGLIGSAICSFGMLGFSLVGQQGYTWTTYGNLACVLIFIVVFNLGPGFVPWVLVSEMFTQSSKGAAMTLTSAGCHSLSVITTFLFPILQVLIGDWTFAIFGTCLVLGTVYVYLKVIETKGKSFDQIQMELRQKLR